MKQISLPFLMGDEELGEKKAVLPDPDVVNAEMSSRIENLKRPPSHNSGQKTNSCKSESAYRTIGEVVTLLAVPAHVLRFWEDKFAILNPLKRNGGRRYYRPEDIEKLFKIKELLYNQGYTIKGVQQIFKSTTKMKIQNHKDANVENDEKNQYKEDLFFVLNEINNLRDYLGRS